jgi:hypothetical protein
MDWYPIKWVHKNFDWNSGNPIEIHRLHQMEGPDLYAVRLHSNCLNKGGKWEYEPSPSNRTDDFFSRCRFGSFEDAANAVAEIKNAK